MEWGDMGCWGKGVEDVRRGAYQALHVADEHAVVEERARLIAVADVVEGFGAILTGEIEEDFLTATVGLVSLLVLGLMWVGEAMRDE